MRSAKKELNVDFIGGQEPLTAAEAAAISNYLQTKKSKHGWRLAMPKKGRKFPWFQSEQVIIASDRVVSDR